MSDPKQLQTKKLMTMRDMADLIGWRTERVRLVLRKRNIAFQLNPGRGNRWYVTIVGLRAHMPEVYILLESEASRRAMDLDEYR